MRRYRKSMKLRLQLITAALGDIYAAAFGVLNPARGDERREFDYS